MKNLILFVALISSCHFANAQELSWNYFVWKDSFGVIYDIVPTKDSGFAVVGQGDSFAYRYYPDDDKRFVYYFDKNKNIIRKSHFKYPERYSKNSNVSPNISVSHGSYYAPSLMENGNYLIVGGIDEIATSPDLMISEFDSNQNIIFEKTWGGSHTDVFRFHTFSENKELIAVGSSTSIDGDIGLHYGSQLENDFVIAKFDSNYNKKWIRVIGGSKEESVGGVKVFNNKIYVAGYTTSNDYDFAFGCFTCYPGRAFLICLQDSTVLWKRLFDSCGLIGGVAWGNEALHVDADGIRFSFKSIGGPGNYYPNDCIGLIKTDTNGNQIYRKNYGSTSASSINLYASCYNPNKKYFAFNSYYSLNANGDGALSGVTGNSKNHMWIFMVDDATGNIIKNYKNEFKGNKNNEAVLSFRSNPYTGNLFAGGTSVSDSGFYSKGQQVHIGFLMEFGDTPLMLNENLEAINSIIIKPNPTYNNIEIIDKVEFHSKRKIELISIDGKILETYIWYRQLSKTINLSGLEMGAYILNIIENNKTIYQSKIIKN